MRSQGLLINITSLINPPQHREVSDLNLKGLVKIEHLSKGSGKGREVLDEYRNRDVVRSVIIGHDEDETISLSFVQEDVDNNIKLVIQFVVLYYFTH
jgi:hypothetical protein